MTPSRTPPAEGRPDAFCRGLLRVFLLVALAVAFLQRLAAAQTAPAPVEPSTAVQEAIPVAVGNAWIYEGEVWWIPRGFRQIFREQITWTMEITDVKRRGPWAAAILHGHPYDLVWYEQGRERGTYMLLMRDRKGGAPRVYLLRGHRVWEAWRRLQDRKDKLKDLARPDEVVLDLPLKAGKRFCPAKPADGPGSGPSKPATPAAPAPTRGSAAGGPGCWSVSDRVPADLRAVRGAGSVAEPTVFSVSQRGPAEHEVWTFVPGLGFTSYAYGHSGEISAVELKLVDFHAPDRLAATALEN